MGSERGPDYYDAKMTRVSEPLESSPWRSVYEKATELLPAPPVLGEQTIADIGCGTGRFAELLRRRGYTRYWGIDFSPARVAEARRYVPQFEFVVGDVLAAETSS